ncbi:Fe-Mn family superoxide dismutase, partial [Halolamina salina]|uniref:Fe-Mn family superoxide dismutase n=1 Tax=Halolamina salina TaxID=1220023 RepID=UPI003615C2D4
MTDYELPPLPYEYDALEPHISEQVLTWHHDTHHQGYVNGWNSAEAPGAIGNVTHNGSGHILHDLFWQSMSPEGGDEPTGALADRIEEDFGSYEAWKGEFEAAAGAAGGWALLVYDSYSNQLRNVVVDKHDQGALWGSHPILALDVWE